ncbi:MAG: YkgJ family cysteine cluster protein [Clostridioides sp.]|nr:YkgJ family cysteine cluster protein [Clostridioides sp.]
MSKLNKKQILNSIDYCNKEGIFFNLQTIYDSVPSGKCSGCGNCCMESVGTNLVEFLNIYNYLLERPKLKTYAFKKILDYYFNEYISKHSCPFKNSKNRCIIYDVRPLNCRIYGQWKKTDYEKNLQNILKENQYFLKFLKSEYNIILPKEVSNFKIDYCEKFIPEKSYLSKSQRLEFADRIFVLDTLILNSKTINIDYADRGIVEFFVESVTDISLANKIKLNRTEIILLNQNK